MSKPQRFEKIDMLAGAIALVLIHRGWTKQEQPEDLAEAAYARALALMKKSARVHIELDASEEEA